MKAMVVDDEAMILNYFKTKVDWEKLGFDDMLFYLNSKEAFMELSSGDIPDLLVTDIKMPEVDGLDLCKLVQGRAKVIIISGFSDFGFAQTAIRYGVSEYLLKPVLAEELEASIEKLVKKDDSSAYFATIDLKAFYLSILFDDTSNKTFLTLNKKLADENYGLDFSANSHQQQLVGSFSFFGKTFGFVKQAGEADATGNNDSFKQQLLDKLYGVKSLDLDNVTLNELTKLIAEEKWAGLIGWLEKNDNVIKKSADDIVLKLWLVLNLPQSLFENLTITDFFALPYGDNLTKLLVKIFMDEEKSVYGKDDLVFSTQKYIMKHIDKKLTLNELAQLCYVHPVYLSRLFKNVTGETLSDYILEKKLERVKLLLETTGLSTEVISTMVSYKKVQNLNDLFKGEYGLTMKKYRQKKLEEKMHE